MLPARVKDRIGVDSRRSMTSLRMVAVRDNPAIRRGTKQEARERRDQPGVIVAQVADPDVDG